MQHWICGGVWRIVRRRGSVIVWQCSKCQEKKIKIRARC